MQGRSGRASDTAARPTRGKGGKWPQNQGGGMLASLKRASNKEARVRSTSAMTVAAAASAATGVATGLPSSTAEFRARFMHQGKEMYKDPPSPPPGGMVVEAESAPPPKQNTTTGELTLAPGDNGGLAGLLRNFVPIAQWYCRFYSRRRCSNDARATHRKGDDGQIAGARSCSDVRQFSGLRGECDQNNNHPTTDRGVQWQWHWTTMHQSN